MRLVSAVLTTVLALTACGGEGGAQDDSVQLVLFGDPVETAGYREMVEAFRAQNPDVEVDFAPVAKQDDLLARLTTAFAAGEPPDVFVVNTRSWGRFAAEGALEPVQPLLEGSTVLDETDFFPTAFSAFRSGDGQLQCMPQNLSSLNVYYNRDLFEAAGVPLPREGWTWDEFLAAAQALTGDGVYGVGTEASLIRLAPFVWSAGGELVDDPDDPTRLTVASGAARTGVDFLLDLRSRYEVTPPEREERSQDSESRFVAGGLAMYLDSRKAVPTLRTIDGFTWDVAPLPVPAGGTPATVLHSDAYCLAADGDTEAGWRLIEFAMSREGQEILAASGRTVPSRRDVASSPVFLDPETPPASAQVFLDVAERIRALPTVPAWAQVEKEGDEILDAVYFGRTPREEGLRRLEERSAELFAGDG